MKKTLMACVFIFLSALLSSCVPTSEQPILPDQGTAKIDAQLNGVWALTAAAGGGTKAIFLHVTAITDATMDLVWVEHRDDGIGVLHYRAFVSAVGDRRYLNIKEWDPENKKEKSETYIFAKYEFTRRGMLKLWLLGNSPYLAEAIEGNKLKGSVTRDSTGMAIGITDTGANIAAFLGSADEKALFGEAPMVFKKVKD